jgi:hypothetical protein
MDQKAMKKNSSFVAPWSEEFPFVKQLYQDIMVLPLASLKAQRTQRTTKKIFSLRTLRLCGEIKALPQDAKFPL